MEILIAFVTTVVSSIVTYLISRRAHRADVLKKELSLADSTLTYYQRLINDFAARLEQATKTINQLEGIIAELERQNAILTKANKEQTDQVHELMQTNQHLIERLEKFKQLK